MNSIDVFFNFKNLLRARLAVIFMAALFGTAVALRAEFRGTRLVGVTTPNRIFLPVIEGTTGGNCNDGSFTLIYDVGFPHLITGFRILPRSTQPGRTANMSVWGSNDQETWQMVATNTIGCVAYQFTDLAAEEGIAAYRYYKFCNAVLNDYEQVALFTEDLNIVADWPLVTDGITLAAPDREEGVLLAGMLRSAPAGSANVKIFVDAVDHGTNYTAWCASSAAYCYDLGVITSNTTFSCNAAGLAAGYWKSRIFAISDGVAMPSQQTMTFVTGSKPYYPVAYVTTNIAATLPSIQNIYNGKTSDVIDTGVGLNFYLGLDDRDQLVTGIRFWPRNQQKFYYHGWWRFRYASYYVTKDAPVWPDADQWVTADRMIRTISTQPPMSWQELYCNAREFYSPQPVGSPNPTMIEMFFPEPVKRATALYLTGVYRWNIGEFELRTLSIPRGTILMLQ